MKEKKKIIKFQNGNTKTETYQEGDTLVTRHFHTGKNAYVKELILVKDGITKIKHITDKGITSKVEHFLADKRQGLETKYFVSRANGTIKSTKTYDNGILHGENITYNEIGEIIKHEVFALGKPVLKYLRENDDNNDITSVEIIDKDSITNLPISEQEKLKNYV